MTETRRVLKSTLDDVLGSSDGVHWVGLVSRDGLCVMESARREIPKETFSAMTATLMGAAEIAFSEVGGGRTRRVIVDADRFRMIVVGASNEMLLVALVDPGKTGEALLEKVDAVAAGIPTTLAGG